MIENVFATSVPLPNAIENVHPQLPIFQTITAYVMQSVLFLTDESTEANIRSGNAYPGTCRKCDRYPFNNPTRLCDESGDDEVTLATTGSDADGK